MAKWLGWEDNSGKPRPRRGPGSVEDVVSHKPPVRAELAVTASNIAARGQALLDILPEKRTGASQVEIEKHDLDYVVILRESAAGSKGGAAGIESRFGILSKAVGGIA